MLFLGVYNPVGILESNLV